MTERVVVVTFWQDLFFQQGGILVFFAIFLAGMVAAFCMHIYQNVFDFNKRNRFYDAGFWTVAAIGFFGTLYFFHQLQLF